MTTSTTYTPALSLPAGQIARVLTVYSDNPHSLLMSKAGAQAWARGIIGCYLTLANRNGNGHTVRRSPPQPPIKYARILDYRLEDLPAHPGVGRVLAICERM